MKLICEVDLTDVETVDEAMLMLMNTYRAFCTSYFSRRGEDPNNTMFAVPSKESYEANKIAEKDCAVLVEAGFKQFNGPIQCRIGFQDKLIDSTNWNQTYSKHQTISAMYDTDTLELKHEHDVDPVAPPAVHD